MRKREGQPPSAMIWGKPNFEKQSVPTNTRIAPIGTEKVSFRLLNSLHNSICFDARVRLNCPPFSSDRLGIKNAEPFIAKEKSKLEAGLCLSENPVFLSALYFGGLSLSERFIFSSAFPFQAPYLSELTDSVSAFLAKHPSSARQWLTVSTIKSE